MRLAAKWRHTTGIVLLVLLLALLGWDIVLVTDDVEGNTISEVLGEGSIVVGWLVCYLMGHFWPREAVLKRMWKVED